MMKTQIQSDLFRVDLPQRRPFHWRTYLVLVALYFLGNIAGIPLLRKTNAPIEPVWLWGVFTLISAGLIAISMFMANRSGLGAPLLEGRITKEDRAKWLKSGLALTVLMCAVGFPLSLVLNLNINPADYPFGWELLPASFKAGVVEEISYRFLLVSLLIWFASLFKRDGKGRPLSGVYWAAILITGLIFGWAHVDPVLSNPAATYWHLSLLMVQGSSLGIFFGWLMWRLGLEWAIFAHFVFDAFVSMIVIPVYLLNNPLVWVILVSGLTLAAIISWRSLWKKTNERTLG